MTRNIIRNLSILFLYISIFSIVTTLVFLIMGKNDAAGISAEIVFWSLVVSVILRFFTVR